MIGNCDAVDVSAEPGLQANMAPGMPGAFGAVLPEQPDEFVTGKITRQSQVEMTSSFTVCRRITGGAVPASK